MDDTGNTNPESRDFFSRIRKPLSSQHLGQLRQAGISDEIIAIRGYETISTPNQLLNLKFPNTQSNPNVKFTHLQAQTAPGILIPLYNVHGNKAGYQFRPDKPRTSGDGKIIKYENPKGQGNMLDLLPIWRADDDPFRHRKDINILITEGVKKADAAASVGMMAISLNGVNGMSGKNADGLKALLEDWHFVPMNERYIIASFDNDVMIKREVHRALASLRELILSKAGLPKYWYFTAVSTDTKVGLDDFLANDAYSGTGKDEKVATFYQFVTDKLKDPVGFDKTKPVNGYMLSDLGNAERLQATYGKRIRYCKEWKVWLYWDGKRWAVDTIGYVNRLAHKTIRGMYDELPKIQDFKEREALAKHAISSESASRLKGMMEIAQSLSKIAVTPDTFNQSPWLFNCNNGTIDLKTGEIRDHEREDYITFISPFDYDPEYRSEAWTTFIDLAASHNEQIKEHLKRVSGYCLTGSVKEGSIHYVLGPSRTGKTTFLQALKQVLGDYAWKTSFDAFLAGRKAGTVRSDIAAMEGKRLVIASEASNGKQFDSDLLKEISAGDEINARALYQSERQIKPELKIMLAANEVPHIRHDDTALWNRLKFVDFNNEALADRKYLDLKQQVMNDPEVGKGILAWAVEGCLQWQEEDDLLVPESVLAATNKVRQSFDPLLDWFDENVEFGPEYHESLTNLHNNYKMFYAGDRSSKPLGYRSFKDSLIKHGFEARKRNIGVMFFGLRLIENPGEEISDDTIL